MATSAGTSAYVRKRRILSAMTVISIAFGLCACTGFDPTPVSDFVQTCGIHLCQRGQPFVIHGATSYDTYEHPEAEVALALRAKLNTLAIVEFETNHHQLSDAMSEATWARIDKFIAAAKMNNLHVILTLSSFAQSLQQAGQTPTRTDWNDYLSFIANRVNTVTHVKYKDEPAIAMVQLWGEICYPGETDNTCPAGTTGTAQDMIDFYHRTLTEWHALAPNILASTGGFSHLSNSSSSGIPWQTIMSDPANPLCELEVNSQSDATQSVGKVTSLCAQIGKPWYLAAWSSCYDDHSYPFYTPSDETMAAHAQDMYDIEHGSSPAAVPAVGGEFWNLKDAGITPGHCDISPEFPLTFSVIQNNAAFSER